MAEVGTIFLMQYVEHIHKLHSSPDSGGLVSSGGESRIEKQRVEIFSRYLAANRPALRAFLSTKLRCREAVEDCLQEVSLTVWRKYDDHWDEESFRRFSFTCARFKALSLLKKTKPKDFVFTDVEVAEKLGRHLELLWEEERKSNSDRMGALERCLDEMPERQREVIMARYGRKDGENLEDISRKRSRSMDAIYKQLERLRSVLRRCVDQRLAKYE